MSGLRVLLVEDDPAYARLLRGILGEGAQVAPTIEWVQDLAAAQARLAAASFDIVLLDLGLPDAEGTEAVAGVVAEAPRTPIVVLSGLADVDTALAAMRVGAQEYLVKGHSEHELLPRAIRYAIERKRLLDYEPMLAGIVGHDLRGPLQTISLSSQLLLKEPLDPAHRRRIERILAASKRASALVNDLLDVTRARLLGEMIRVTRAPVDLALVVRDLVDEFEVTGGGRRAAYRASGSAEGAFDGPRIAQAVGNLLRNAGQHGAADGKVTVALGGDAGEVTIEVHNEGPPIPPARLQSLFEPLKRAGASQDGSGLGLGLYIVQEIVRAHGGRVEAASTATTGTTFRMVLPRDLPSDQVAG